MTMGCSEFAEMDLMSDCANYERIRLFVRTRGCLMFARKT